MVECWQLWGMDRDELSSLIEARECQTDDDITISEHHQVYLGEEYGKGELSVEYKPGGNRIEHGGLEAVGESGFFKSDLTIEEMVADLYMVLVSLLYPQSDYLEEPWDRLPLVVSIEHEAPEDHSTYYASLGSYR